MNHYTFESYRMHMLVVDDLWLWRFAYPSARALNSVKDDILEGMQDDGVRRANCHKLSEEEQPFSISNVAEPSGARHISPGELPGCQVVYA